jgi:hypothetical protein
MQKRTDTKSAPTVGIQHSMMMIDCERAVQQFFSVVATIRASICEMARVQKASGSPAIELTLKKSRKGSAIELNQSHWTQKIPKRIS